MIPKKATPDEYEHHRDTYASIVATVKAENAAHAASHNGIPKWNGDESIGECKKRLNQWLESLKQTSATPPAPLTTPKSTKS